MTTVTFFSSAVPSGSGAFQMLTRPSSASTLRGGSSPVNILKDPPQIATEGFSMVLRPERFLE